MATTVTPPPSPTTALVLSAWGAPPPQIKLPPSPLAPPPRMAEPEDIAEMLASTSLEATRPTPTPAETRVALSICEQLPEVWGLTHAKPETFQELCNLFVQTALSRAVGRPAPPAIRRQNASRATISKSRPIKLLADATVRDWQQRGRPSSCPPQLIVSELQLPPPAAMGLGAMTLTQKRAAVHEVVHGHPDVWDIMKHSAVLIEQPEAL